MTPEAVITKIDSLISKAKHECTMSGNIDAVGYLKSLKRWISKITKK